MNISLFFSALFIQPREYYPEYITDNTMLRMHTPRHLYCTAAGVKKQFDRIQGTIGSIKHWIESEPGVFHFETFWVDKNTMYFEKVPFEIFWDIFVQNNSEIKTNIIEELTALLREEYDDSYELYLPNIMKG